MLVVEVMVVKKVSGKINALLGDLVLSRDLFAHQINNALKVSSFKKKSLDDFY